jgi:hypothetical protein
VGTTHYRRNKNIKTSERTTKTGYNNMNKEDTRMIWTNGRLPKKGRGLKIKIENNNNFKDDILKTNYFKQNNFNECQ